MFYSTRLKNLRERIGISQSKAGKIINLDSGTYSHYENEDIIIPIKHLITLCNYFNVSLDYIFNFTNNNLYENLKNNIDKKIMGQNLKNLRKENKITQVKLAEILKVSQSTIAEYERGTNVIATPFLYTICKKYNISADYLLGRTSSPIYLK